MNAERILTIFAYICIIIAFLTFACILPFDPTNSSSHELVLDNGLYTVKCDGKLTVGKTVQPLILVCISGEPVEEIEYIR